MERSAAASYPEWKIVFSPPKEFPWLLSNIDAFVVPEVFFHYCLSKNLSMTEKRRERKKVSCHMLEVFFKKCAWEWENAFWAAATASSQIYLHGHNSVARLLLLRSFAAKVLLHPPASQLMHHPTTYFFFLLLLCLLSLLLLLRPELSFFSFC